VRNYFVLIFQIFSQRRSWDIEMFGKFCHLLFSLFNDTTMSYFLHNWKTAFLFHSLGAASQKLSINWLQSQQYLIQ